MDNSTLLFVSLWAIVRLVGPLARSQMRGCHARGSVRKGCRAPPSLMPPAIRVAKPRTKRRCLQGMSARDVCKDCVDHVAIARMTQRRSRAHRCPLLHGGAACHSSSPRRSSAAPQGSAVLRFGTRSFPAPGSPRPRESGAHACTLWGINVASVYAFEQCWFQTARQAAVWAPLHPKGRGNRRRRAAAATKAGGKPWRPASAQYLRYRPISLP